MKNISLLLLFIISAAACKKDRTSQQPDPNAGKTLSSVWTRDFTSHKVDIDSFLYDNSNRLVNYTKYNSDSSANPAPSAVFESKFIYNGADTLPSSYNNGTGLHNLSYNSNNKIIEDSLSSSSNTIVYSFNYGTDTIFSLLRLSPQIGNYVDTLVMQGDNVVTKRNSFVGPGPGNSFYSVDNITYSSYTNPLFNFKGFGLELYSINGKNLDYISKNLYSSAVHVNGFTENVDWTQDANGHLTGNKTFTSSGRPYHIEISFHYK